MSQEDKDNYRKVDERGFGREPTKVKYEDDENDVIPVKIPRNASFVPLSREASIANGECGTSQQLRSSVIAANYNLPLEQLGIHSSGVLRQEFECTVRIGSQELKLTSTNCCKLLEAKFHLDEFFKHDQ